RGRRSCAYAAWPGRRSRWSSGRPACVRRARCASHGGGGTKTARQHVEAILAGEPKIPMTVGGAKSEENWRTEFRAAGLPVMEPEVMDSTTTARNTSSVEVGISRVYSAINRGELKFFDDVGHEAQETPGRVVGLVRCCAGAIAVR